MKRRILPPAASLLSAVLFLPTFAFAQKLPANTNQSRSTTLKSFIAGGSGNLISSNTITAFIGGGEANTANSQAATIGGGILNTNSGFAATIGGGKRNTVSGGFGSPSSGDYATIGGGEENTASSKYATVPGGYGNEASGEDSFAAGARARATNAGAFVWSIYAAPTVSTNANSFTVRAPGGTRFLSTISTNVLVGVILTNGATDWASLSDSNSKTDFESIRPREILSKVAALPVTAWHYKHNPNRRYIGPMAQDFRKAFGLGSDDKTISTLDSDGVMYAAIQGLVEELKERDQAMATRDRTIEELKQKNSELSRCIEEINNRLGLLPPAH